MTGIVPASLPFQSKLIPVLTIENIEQASPLARALYEGGLDVAEVTFRTPNAHEAIRAMKEAVPEMSVGAGTILSAAGLDRALSAGSDFIITPAMTPSLLMALSGCNTPVYPGVGTAGEAQTLFEHGYSTLKFFPAEASGGAPFIKSIAAPLPHITFIPTGGINAALAPNYLSLPNVTAVGGSWMVDKTALQNQDWDGITKSVTLALEHI